MIRLDAATVLLQTDQPEEAEALFRLAAAEREISESLLATALEGRIEALRALGRSEEAEIAEAELQHLKARLASAEGHPPQA